MMKSKKSPKEIGFVGISKKALLLYPIEGNISIPACQVRDHGM